MKIKTLAPAATAMLLRIKDGGDADDDDDDDDDDVDDDVGGWCVHDSRMGDVILEHYGSLPSCANSTFPLVAGVRTIATLRHQIFPPVNLILTRCQRHAEAITATNFVPLRQLIHCNSVSVSIKQSTNY